MREQGGLALQEERVRRFATGGGRARGGGAFSSVSLPDTEDKTSKRQREQTVKGLENETYIEKGLAWRRLVLTHGHAALESSSGN